MKLTPYGDKIIVRKEEKKLSEVIDLQEAPAYSEKRPARGVVVAVNKDHNPNTFVKAGDVVVFGMHVADEVPDIKGLYVIMEPDIWYKIEGDTVDPRKLCKGDN